MIRSRITLILVGVDLVLGVAEIEMLENVREAWAWCQECRLLGPREEAARGRATVVEVVEVEVDEIETRITTSSMPVCGRNSR